MKTLKDKLLGLLSEFHNSAVKNKLDYSIDGGTLLGAVRHKGLIPWDDDLDIMVLKSKVNKSILKKMFKDLDKNGIKYIKNEEGYKLFFETGDKIEVNPWINHIRKFKKKHPEVKGRANISKKASKTYKKSKKKMYQPYLFPFLDLLFVTEKDKRTRYNKNRWEKCFHTTNSLYPLKTYKMNKLKVFGPNNPNGYLDSCYKNWRKEAYKSYDHSKEKILEKKIMKL